MTTIWLVIQGDYDGSYPVAAYASQTAAETSRTEHEANNRAVGGEQYGWYIANCELFSADD